MPDKAKKAEKSNKEEDEVRYYFRKKNFYYNLCKYIV